jgi:hypothetical protein
MALAAILIDVFHEQAAPGPPPPSGYRYSWISKAKATGLNKHLGFFFATLLWYWWRNRC